MSALDKSELRMDAHDAHDGWDKVQLSKVCQSSFGETELNHAKLIR